MYIRTRVYVVCAAGGGCLNGVAHYVIGMQRKRETIANP
jgi:hypothetical protein